MKAPPRRIRGLLGAWVAASLAAGCAHPIAQEQTIAVTVETDLPGWKGPLDCRASNAAGSWAFTAPGTVSVLRSSTPLQIRCETPPGAVLKGGEISGLVGALRGAGAHHYPSPVALHIHREVPANGPQRLAHPLGEFEHVEGSTGVLITAPHGTFDAGTDSLAIAVAAELGAGYVVARHFTPNRIRINVNRPTEGAFSSCANESRTERAQSIHDTYLGLVRRASAAGQLELYVEIHGNSNPLTARHVEVATVGVSDAQARRAKEAFTTMLSRARARAASYPALELMIEPIDRLHFSAACAKTQGVFASDAVTRGLHVELPRAAREGDALRGSASLIADLVRELLRTQP